MIFLLKARTERLSAENEELKNQIEGLTYNVNQISDNVLEVDKKNDSEMPVGDYLNPIIYNKGDKVFSGNFYTDNTDIWEAYNTGIPNGFDDESFFEIIK